MVRIEEYLLENNKLRYLLRGCRQILPNHVIVPVHFTSLVVCVQSVFQTQHFAQLKIA